jgi:hypothetical protein
VELRKKLSYTGLKIATDELQNTHFEANLAIPKIFETLDLETFDLQPNPNQRLWAFSIPTNSSGDLQGVAAFGLNVISHHSGLGFGNVANLKIIDDDHYCS